MRAVSVDGPEVILHGNVDSNLMYSDAMNINMTIME